MLRRFVPLLVGVALSIAVLLARLWDVQVVQHDIWARESVNLVRSHAFEPYVRGALRDRNGELLVRDEETYALEFVWRDFRRGHPLGQVAMMRSLALMRPVGLDEAQGDLVESALAYAALSPDDLQEFSRGESLDAGIDFVPAIATESPGDRREAAWDERRRSRSIDIRFYLVRLLELSRRDVKALDGLVEDGGKGDRSFLELTATVTEQSVEQVTAELIRRVQTGDEHLERLASLIDWNGDDVPADLLEGADRPAARLVALIEERRRTVDDETADDLFRIAVGFSPSRLSAANLRLFDLDWLRAALDWDELRLEQWIGRRGSAFEQDAGRWIAGRVIARAKIEGAAPADRLVSALAHAFRSDADAWSRKEAKPADWRTVDSLVVLSSLPSRLERGDEVPGNAGELVMPFQDPERRTRGVENDLLLMDHFGAALKGLSDAEFEALRREALERHGETVGAGEIFSRIPMSAVEIARRLVLTVESRRKDWNAVDETRVKALLMDLYRRLQGRVSQVLQPLAGGENGEVEIAAPWVEKALETRRYVVRDRGARAKVVGGEPRTDLVLLVTRYGTEFAGFRVTSQSRRVPIALREESDSPVAAEILGKVRSPFLVAMLEQAPRMEELWELQRKIELPKEDRQRILALWDAAYHRGERVGGNGIEAWYDRELSGKSGYREVLGLQDRVEGNRTAISRSAKNGKDVTLTLDLGLQRAAESVINKPKMPPRGDRDVDELWFEQPVGAIVLATVEGELLAAASAPLVKHDRAMDFTDGESLQIVERTLGRPRFQPPGSVVKPLLAAYALEHLGLDPNKGIWRCQYSNDHPREGTKPKRATRAGYGRINCNVRWGHSGSFAGRPLNVTEALMVSCNVYFAGLGEEHFDGASMRDAYSVFGFGAPTGVRTHEGEGRSGLLDSFWYNPKSPLHADQDVARVDEVSRQFLGNGLASIDANAVQVARAYAGLATGQLPEMSLVKAVGDESLPRRARALGISEDRLDIIRSALEEVVHSRFGTANKAPLGTEDLDFRLAAKTGSADYQSGKVTGLGGRGRPLDEYIDGTRKHTWLAGWFPAEAPRFVVVIYIHDTGATASHSAAYVASQFLRTDDVRALMDLPPLPEDD